MILVIYVDDVVIFGRSESLVDAFVVKFRKTYETTEPETANWILGILRGAGWTQTCKGLSHSLQCEGSPLRTM